MIISFILVTECVIWGVRFKENFDAGHSKGSEG